MTMEGADDSVIVKPKERESQWCRPVMTREQFLKDLDAKGAKYSIMPFQTDATQESSETIQVSSSMKSTTANDGNEALVISSNTDSVDAVRSHIWDEYHEWPLAPFCELLAVHLFDAAWEVRHGASIGLREVLSHYGRSAGYLGTICVTHEQITGKPKSDHFIQELVFAAQKANHRRYLHDLACRCLCLLALDRFTDYVGDSIMVPVRESGAQVLGLVSSLLRDYDDVLPLLEHGLLKLCMSSGKDLTKLLQAKYSNDTLQINRAQMSLKLGGLIGLKYVLAARHEDVAIWLQRTDVCHVLQDG